MTGADRSGDYHHPRLHRTGGVAVLVGVLGLLVHVALDTRLPQGSSGPGDVDRFVTRATHPLWAPYQVTELLGILFITLGLFFLYRTLLSRGEVGFTIAWVFTATLAAATRVVEFALAATVFPSFLSSFSTDLSPAQLDTVVQGYRAMGAGLLVIIAVFTGLSVALLGAALYRARLFHPLIGGGGVVLGVYQSVATLVPNGSLTLGILDTVSTVVLWLWLVAIAVSMIRTAPGSK